MVLLSFFDLIFKIYLILSKEILICCIFTTQIIP